MSASFAFYRKQRMDDVLINFGGEIKSFGDGRLGGYLVKFGDPTDTDLVGDFFTKETDFGIEDGAKTPIYLNHRGPLKTRDGKQVVVKQKIGEGTLKLDDAGVLIDAILYEREKYEAALTSMGWSSGTAAHLTDREPVGKAWHIKSWPLGVDASATPRPCQPHKTALSLKAYFEESEEDKGILEDEMAQRSPAVWEVWSAFTSALEKVARTAADASVTGAEIDVESKVKEAAFALPDKLVPIIVSQIADFINSDSREHFYLKQFSTPEDLVSESLDSHSESVVSAVAESQRLQAEVGEHLKQWLARLRDKQEFRLKSGRVISHANRERIAQALQKLTESSATTQAITAALTELLEMAEAKPKSVDPDEIRGMVAAFEHMRLRRTLHAARR